MLDSSSLDSPLLKIRSYLRTAILKCPASHVFDLRVLR